MKHTTPLLAAALFVLASCSGTEQARDQSDPANVVEAIFEAAKSGNFDNLKALCDPQGENDGDTDAVCGVSDASEDVQREFVTYFEKGRITGEPRIEEDEAAVDFTFGPDGTSEETMNLVKRGEAWYLSSF